jgi:Family of unknown function (DUF5338)
MTASLSARIAKNELKQNSSMSKRNRAVFFSLESDIKEALADGWSLRCIWRTLHKEGKVSYSYDTFRRYAGQLKEGGLERSVNVSDTKKGFIFNPVPNKEELI